MSLSICTESSDSKSRHMCTVISASICLLAVAGVFSSKLEGADVPTVEQLRNQPVAFTKNRGQWDSQVLYRAANSGSTMWFTKDGIYYQFTRVRLDPTKSDQMDKFTEARVVEQLMIKAEFVDANVGTSVISEGLQEYKCNYFLGNDESRWQSDVPNYESIRYNNLYEGVDLEFRSEANRLVAEFLLSPGSSSKRIKMRYDGIESISVDHAGHVTLSTNWGSMTAPMSIAPIQDGSATISVHQELSEERAVVWTIDSESILHNAARLVVSPTYSTYIGGSSGEYVADMAVNSNGEAYLTGDTYSSDFPKVGAYDITIASNEGFLTKFSASGSSLIFSTYLGGSGGDRCLGLSLVNGSTYSVFLCGTTSSSDFPMSNAIDASANGNDDAFVACIGPTGNTLPFSTYLGGSTWDRSFDVAAACVFPCDMERYTVWVVGNTQSANFPAALAYSATLNGFSDAFLTSYNVGVTGISFGRSTFFGGGAEDFAHSVMLQNTNPVRPVITGYTRSSDFPLVSPYDATLASSQDAFVSAFAFAGNGVMYPTFSTYFGGNDFGTEYASSIVRRSSGNACIAGTTTAGGLATSGAYDMSVSAGDAFLAEFNLNTGALVACTYFGGSSGDEAHGLIEKNGNLYVVGLTTSSDLPMVNAYDNAISGASDAFVGVFNSNMASLLWSSYIGGSDYDGANCVAVDNSYCIYTAGSTLSNNFPLVNPYDPINNANNDGFLIKICVPLYTCGDADGSATVTISDAVLLINYIFAGGPAPNPLLSGDADCSGSVTISDAVHLINYIFAGGAAPCASCP